MLIGKLKNGATYDIELYYIAKKKGSIYRSQPTSLYAEGYNMNNVFGLISGDTEIGYIGGVLIRENE